MNYDIEVLIIGAGVVGLAIAARLLESGMETAIIEKNHTYGLETSSRNSEVIHSGIHYPSGSLKAKLSVEGNRVLYDFCNKNGITHHRTGKVTVAVKETEVDDIERLFKQGNTNGVPGLEVFDKKKLKEFEPEINGYCALFSPTTGIINVHFLMDSFVEKIKDKRGLMVFGSRMKGAEFSGNVWKIFIEGRNGMEKYTSKVIINSTGLYADEIAQACGVDIDGYGGKLHWCKGDYFSYHRKLNVHGLVYPVPGKTGLGIHLTPKLDGLCHFGPDAEYVERKTNPYPLPDAKSDFFVDDSKKEQFYNDVRLYLPSVKKELFEPEMYGIRPKLQGPNEFFRDFIISEESSRGLPGLVNLIGIESPGLTSCLAIAKYVAGLL